MYITVTLLLCLGIVFSENVEPLLKPCAMNDVECMQKSCTELLTKSATGLGAPYNIEPVDPMTVPPMDRPVCCDEPPKRTIHLKNIKVTGFKDIKIVNIRFDLETKKADINSTADFKITADVSDLNNPDLAGISEISAKTINRINYDFDMKKDDNGVERFHIGPHTTTCEIISISDVNTTPPTVKEELIKDIDFKTNGDKIIEKRKEFVCKMALEGYKRVVEAFKQVSKVMTTADFFQN